MAKAHKKTQGEGAPAPAPAASSVSEQPESQLVQGVVVKLDRGFPLVRIDEGVPTPAHLRCEHATALVKGKPLRAAIGDCVTVQRPAGHDKGIIQEILPRRTAFVRKDPADRTAKQVLAANFDCVVVVEPFVDLNQRRLERELVLAHDTGAQVAVVLTKADLVDAGQRDRVLGHVQDLAGRTVPVLAAAMGDLDAIERVRKLVPLGQTAILVGKSGVGKSTLVNLLAGCQRQETGHVRAVDGKGRHTTVDRVLVPVPGGGAVVDMPGLRGLGLWEADQGLDRAFFDVEALANRCRFRDCSHGAEPGCAVREAVEAGDLAPARLESYRSLAAEIQAVRLKRDEARRLRGQKASMRGGKGSKGPSASACKRRR